MPARRAHLHPLTGLRFLAAFHVFLFHIFRPHLAEGPQWLQNFASEGAVGVSLFFVLSGFILAYNYLGGDRGPLRPRAFWVARFARIYPMYALGLLVAAPFFFGPLIAANTPAMAAFKGTAIGGMAVTLTQAWTPWSSQAWNAPGWSLSVEAFFYLLFPLLAGGVIARLSRRPWLSITLLWLATLLLPTLYWLLDLGGLWVLSDGAQPLWLVVAYNPLIRLPEFLIGMVAGVWFLNRKPATDPTASAHAVGRWLSLGAGVTAFALLTVTAYLPEDLYVHNGLLSPLFALLIIGLAFGGGPLAWLLSTPALLLLGEASYGLYLLHMPLWHWAQTFAAATGLDSTTLLFALAYTAVTLAICILALKLVEDPARRFLRRRLSGPRKTEKGGSGASVPSAVTTGVGER